MNVVHVNGNQNFELSGNSQIGGIISIIGGNVSFGLQSKVLEKLSSTSPISKEINDEYNLLRLKDLLHQRQWIEADRETCRAMLRIKERK